MTVEFDNERTAEYIPLGREFELWLRATDPEYRIARDNQADDWRRLRQRVGAEAARRAWGNYRRGVAVLNAAIVENMFREPPGAREHGLGKLLLEWVRDETQ